MEKGTGFVRRHGFLSHSPEQLRNMFHDWEIGSGYSVFVDMRAVLKPDTYGFRSKTDGRADDVVVFPMRVGNTPEHGGG